MKHHLKPLAACMAAVFSATSFNAWGAPPATPPVQNQNAGEPGTAPPAPTVSPLQPPRATASVFPEQPKEFPGIPWGSFLVYPDVSLSVTYDDNIYAERPFAGDPLDPLRRTSLTADVIYTLSPSIEFKSNWKQHALNFDLGGDFDRYQDNDSEDVNDYWMGFDGHYDLNARTNIFGGARHSRDHEDRSTPSNLISQAQVEPTLYDHEEAHLGLAHSSGAYRLRVGGTWDQYDYDDGALPSGLVVDNDYRDHDLSSLGVRLGYVLSPRYEIFGQYATDDRTYDNLINLVGFNRDSDGYRAAAGVRFTLQPQRLAGEAFAGVMSQKYDYSGFSDISKPYFGALVVWKPTTQVTATGFIDRTLEETTVFSGTDFAAGTLDTTYGFEVEHRLTSNLTATGRAAYTHSDFQSFDRLDKIIDAGAGLRYYVQPTVYVGADLRIVDRDSDDPAGQYSRNQVMVSVGYTPARNRDYAIIPEREAGAPAAPRAPGVFSGFYLGAQLGHGGLTTDTFGLRHGGGSDAATMGGFGASYGLFAGWGTEVNNWYVGIELDAGDSDAGWYHKKDADNAPTTFVDKDDSYGLSARVGYLLDGGLVYGTLGVVETDFHSYYADNAFVAGAFDDKHSETGTRLGFGLEMQASSNLFVRTEYSYTDYDEYGVSYLTQDGITTDSFETSDIAFSLGLGWRFGDERPAVATRPATELRGLYMGAHFGHGTLGTELTGVHNSVTDPTSFTGDFAKSGFTGGFFAGYGHTYDQFYIGLELEAEAANFGWEHERVAGGGPGGRDFAADKRGSYGGALRLGYVLPNGGLLYGRVGAVQTRFNTFYVRGAATPDNQSDTLSGTRYGLGAEMPASENTFVRMDYSYTHYSDAVDVVSNNAADPDDMSFDNSESLVRLGLGFRF